MPNRTDVTAALLAGVLLVLLVVVSVGLWSATILGSWATASP